MKKHFISTFIFLFLLLFSQSVLSATSEDIISCYDFNNDKSDYFGNEVLTVVSGTEIYYTSPLDNALYYNITNAIILRQNLTSNIIETNMIVKYNSSGTNSGFITRTFNTSGNVFMRFGQRNLPLVSSVGLFNGSTNVLNPYVNGSSTNNSYVNYDYNYNGSHYTLYYNDNICLNCIGTNRFDNPNYIIYIGNENTLFLDRIIFFNDTLTDEQRTAIKNYSCSQIDGYFNSPPALIGSINDIQIGLNTNGNEDLSLYFTNYDTIYLQGYDDASPNATITLNSTQTSYSDENVTLQLIGTIIYVTSYETDKSYTFLATAENGVGTANDIFFIEIVPAFTPPSLIANITDMQLGFNSTGIRKFNTYFNNYDYIRIDAVLSGENLSLFGQKTGSIQVYDSENISLRLIPRGSFIELQVESHEKEITDNINVTAINSYGYVEQVFLLDVNANYPSGTFEEISNPSTDETNSLLESIFPPSESLGTRTKLLYVAITILITLILVIVLSLYAENYGGLVAGIGVFLAFLELFLFALIGYLPVLLIVILCLIIAFGIYMFIVSKINGG